MRLFVTGGAGFIGSNFVRHVLAARPDWHVLNFDLLTYAGNLQNLADVADFERYRFLRGDIADPVAVTQALAEGFDVVVNFAAESHVDRSIENSAPFLRTNVMGVQVLLDAARRCRVPLFIQISTDEVYGSAAPGQSFQEDSILNPGSPYAASKAAADLVVSSYRNTYSLPVMTLRCTNNYGPYQFPEKLIPLVIANALENKPIPVYGDGRNERDWLFVEDYCRAIECAVANGRPGELYNVSSGSPQPNLKIVRAILHALDRPESLIQFVDDRLGHDRRYSLDSSRFARDFGWKPQVSLEEGLRRTIQWYRAHTAWLDQARSGEYLQYYERHYARRLEASKYVLD